jgi:hypothetical protein
MKKLFVFLILVMSVLMLKAGGEATGYVKVGDETYFCEKVKPGLFNMNLTLDNGTIIKVPLKKVDSYSCNGRMFERLPVMCKGAPENCTELMEYVTSRNGFRLYKYSTVQEHGELYDNTYKKAHQEFELFVFKDGKFCLQVTKENIESVLPFFGIQVI